MEIKDAFSHPVYKFQIGNSPVNKFAIDVSGDVVKDIAISCPLADEDGKCAMGYTPLTGKCLFRLGGSKHIRRANKKEIG